MRARPFVQVDVFGAEPYRGNPLAVVLDAEGLSTEEMQRFGDWAHLSETTFLLPPTAAGADYRLRIFTPDVELPFAGHPTLGSAHAWLEAGGEPAAGDVVVQECDAGLVRVRRDGDRLAFDAPPLVRSGPVDEDEIADFAGLFGLGRGDVVDAQWVDNGPGWVALLLEDAVAVLAVVPDVGDRRFLDVGFVGFHPAGHEAAIEVRAFFRGDGALAEDPVTGSLNASLAQWLLGSGRLTAPYVVAQGAALGRAGRVYIDQDEDGTIWVGGGTVTAIRGEVSL